MLPIAIEPALAEDAVFAAMRGHADEREFLAARDRLYLLAAERREAAFVRFYSDWFERLGLGRVIGESLSELPILAEHCARCVVQRVSSGQDEGADLLVASDVAGVAGRTVAVRLRAVTFEDAAGVRQLLRAELLQVSDMVDPSVGYDPQLPPVDGGPSYERLLRQRYRVLWEVRTAGRLVRRGVLDASVRSTSLRAFSGTFPMLGATAEQAFVRFFDGEVRTHAEMMTFALVPRTPAAGVALVVGGHCPLCRFPTYVLELDPTALPATIAAAIAADFPTWQMDHGLCHQCADLYRARATSGLESLPAPSVEANRAQDPV